MTSDELVYRDRLNIFKYYLGNDISVTDLCVEFNRSRTWFYRWYPRFQAYGEEGLRDIERSIPAMPNQVPLDIETAILDFIGQYPAYGPQRIADELTLAGTVVKRSAVYNVLKRHTLNTRKKRLEYLRIKNGVVETASDLERDREQAKHRSLNTRYPGHIVSMDTFYVGTIKGLGRVYQFTAIDTYSSYGWANLFLDKSAKSACDFLAQVRNSRGEIPFHAIMTDNGKEFTTHWESKNHDFERLLKELQIQHRLTKVRHPWTNGACERLNRTIFEEFHQVAFRSKIYSSLEELNQDLQNFMRFYNTQRTHHGKRTLGNTPQHLFQATNAA
jgi:transposase InsO family protein